MKRILHDDGLHEGRWMFFASSYSVETVLHRRSSDTANSTMRVLIIMPSASPKGGAEEALVQLCENAYAESLEVNVVFLENGELVERIRGTVSASTVFEAGRLRDPVRFLKTVVSIKGLCERWRADVVVGWMTKAHIYGGIAAMWAQIPAVCFQMGVPDSGSVDRLSRLIPAAGILTCSEFAAREQRKVVNCPVVGVPLAADCERFDISRMAAPGEMKRQLGFAVSRPLIGIVGRLQRWKGIHIFLEAMALINRVYPDVQGVVVGGQHDLEPDYPTLLNRTIKTLGLEEVVRMVGVQRNIPEWMQAMDVVVHASEREPFGIVVVEAMALGKPVIASVPGGPEEIIESGSNGLLVRSGYPDELASAIRCLLDAPQLAKAYADAAKLSSDNFTAQAFVRRFSTGLTQLAMSKHR